MVTVAPIIRCVHMQIGLLSGGQRRRLQLAAVLRRRPNMLLLDEVRAEQALLLSCTASGGNGTAPVHRPDSRAMRSTSDPNIWGSANPETLMQGKPGQMRRRPTTWT
jgi:ABC transporter